VVDLGPEVEEQEGPAVADRAGVGERTAAAACGTREKRLAGPARVAAVAVGLAEVPEERDQAVLVVEVVPVAARDSAVEERELVDREPAAPAEDLDSVAVATARDQAVLAEVAE
jgi:hypothetical protein